MTLFSALMALAGIWLLAVTIPGPNFIVVSQHSMADSRQSGIFIALGVSSAACVWATSSLLGLKAVFEHANWLYDTIRLVGSLYLIYLGTKILIGSFKNDKGRSTKTIIFESKLKAYRLGLMTSFSNPKTAAFFGSIFVTTFPPESPPWAFFVTVGIIFSISMAWYSTVALFFSLSRIRNGYERFRKLLDRLTGSLLLILGIRLACSRS